MTPESNTPAPWWLDPGFIAFDTETTGVDPASDRIVTAAMVNFANGEVTSEHEWLLKLEIPIPPASTQVHGITDEHPRRTANKNVKRSSRSTSSSPRGRCPSWPSTPP